MDSLRSVAQLLTEAYQPLHDTVHGRADVPEHHSLDTTFLAVKATADVSMLDARPADCTAGTLLAALCWVRGGSVCDRVWGLCSWNRVSTDRRYRVSGIPILTFGLHAPPCLH